MSGGAGEYNTNNFIGTKPFIFFAGNPGCAIYQFRGLVKGAFITMQHSSTTDLGLRSPENLPKRTNVPQPCPFLCSLFFIFKLALFAL